MIISTARLRVIVTVFAPRRESASSREYWAILAEVEQLDYYFFLGAEASQV
jgi:hypothetical protein